MDKVDKNTRSEIMASVKASGNKSTELPIRMGLVRACIKGWIIRPSTIIGKPDFYFIEKRIAVFVDGCFWHGCPICYRRPMSNKKYWDSKLERVKVRDKKVNNQLANEGIHVFRVWEHEIKNKLPCIIHKLMCLLDKC